MFLHACRRSVLWRLPNGYRTCERPFNHAMYVAWALKLNCLERKDVARWGVMRALRQGGRGVVRDPDMSKTTAAGTGPKIGTRHGGMVFLVGQPAL